MANKLQVIFEVVGRNLKEIDKVRASMKKVAKTAVGVAKAAAAITAVVAAVGFTATKLVNVAAKMEMFNAQLLAVTKSAGEASEALAAIREFARTSPLETEDVVQSYVRLRAVGIDPTMEQMRTLGGVAILFNREMTDVLNGFIGLNKRTLREVGIEIDRTGAKAIIQSGNVRKVVEKDSGSIRGAIIEIWEARFPNALEVAAATTKAKVAIMKSDITELSAEVGLLLKPAFDSVTEAIGNMAAALRRTLLDSQIRKLEADIISFKDRIATGFKVESVTTGPGAGYVRKTKLTAADKAEIRKNIEEAQKEIAEIEKRIKGGSLTGSGDLGGLDDEEGDKGAKKVDLLLKNIVAFAKRSKELQREIASQNSDWMDELVEQQMARDAQIIESKKRLRDAGISSIRDEAERESEELKARHEDELALYAGNEQAITNIKKAHELERAELTRRYNLLQVQYVTDTILEVTSRTTAFAKNIVTILGGKTRDIKGLLMTEAIVRGAVSTVTAIQAAWETANGNYYLGAALSAAAVIENAALVGAQLTQISKAERGTMSSPGGLTLVGEAGPELVRMPAGSQVFTAGETQRMRQGGGTDNSIHGTTFNIYNQATGDQLIRMLRNGELRDFVTDFKFAMAS